MYNENEAQKVVARHASLIKVKIRRETTSWHQHKVSCEEIRPKSLGGEALWPASIYIFFCLPFKCSKLNMLISQLHPQKQAKLLQ